MYDEDKLKTESVPAYLSLGSNMGDRQKNLDKALDFLSQRLRVSQISSIYESDPIGNTEQPRFLNMVCHVYTRLTPQGLLTLAKGIESKLGRSPGKTNAPRPIDIDILLYDREVVETPELVIPHPRMTERAFVLVPLVEITPDLMHPVIGKTARELLLAITEKQGVFKWGTD